MRAVERSPDRQRRPGLVSEPRHPQDFVSHVRKRRGIQRRFRPAPENSDDIAPQAHHMPDRHAGWMKAGPGPYWQRPVDPPGQATRGANRRGAAAWQGTSSWAGGQWRPRLAGGGTRRHGHDGDGNKDNGHSGPHMWTIRRLRARAATSAPATGSALKAGRTGTAPNAPRRRSATSPHRRRRTPFPFQSHPGHGRLTQKTSPRTPREAPIELLGPSFDRQPRLSLILGASGQPSVSSAVACRSSGSGGN